MVAHACPSDAARGRRVPLLLDGVSSVMISHSGEVGGAGSFVSSVEGGGWFG